MCNKVKMKKTFLGCTCHRRNSKVQNALSRRINDDPVYKRLFLLQLKNHYLESLFKIAHIKPLKQY